MAAWPFEDSLLAVDEFCAEIMSASQPWLPAEHWWAEFDDLSSMRLVFTDRYGSLLTKAPWSALPLGPAILISLPYLESHMDRRPLAREIELPEEPRSLKLLVSDRLQMVASSELARAMGEAEVPRDVQNFLLDWTERRIRVTGWE